MVESISDKILLLLYSGRNQKDTNLSKFMHHFDEFRTYDLKCQINELIKNRQISISGSIHRLASTEAGIKYDLSNTIITGRILDNGIKRVEEILRLLTKGKKYHLILQYLSQQNEKHPNKGSFSSVEIQEHVFYNLLSIKEVEFLIRQLISFGDARDCITKDSVDIGYKYSTEDALFSGKYLDDQQLIIQPPINMIRDFTTEISEVFEKKYLKVYLKETEDLSVLVELINGLKSVRTVNVTESSGKEKKNLTVYPSRVYDITETQKEVEFILNNYFTGSKLDPIFENETISTISIRAYYQIIDHIIYFGRNMEKMPKILQNFDEEDLRNYFLPYLNTISKNHISTGETFNKKGKTDILIQDLNGINVFIAECKIWHGSGELMKAIDQLMERYVSWNDERVALIIFDKDVLKYSELIESAIEATKMHPLFKEYFGKRNDTSASFTLKQSEDEKKEIKVELLFFNCVQN